MDKWVIEQSDSYLAVDQEVKVRGQELGISIDEVALMTGSLAQWQSLSGRFVYQGWELFNQAQDTVHTEPFGLTYGVRYAFFRRPEVPWRIELMRPDFLVAQYSPLHEAFWSLFCSEIPTSGFLPVVHFSYKVLTEGDYEMEVERLGTHNYLHGQSCRSTYGRFSYFRKGITGPYVKPRVNLRDTGGVVHAHGQHGEHYHSGPDYRTHQQPLDGEVFA